MHLFVYFWPTQRTFLASLGLLRQTVLAAEVVLKSHITVPLLCPLRQLSGQLYQINCSSPLQLHQ